MSDLPRPGICRISHQRFEDLKPEAEADRVAALTTNILKEKLADTFLGRKHYDLIPLPYELE